MKRGTTPTHTFTLPFDVDVISCVRIVYAQDERVKLVKTGEDVKLDGNAVSVKLTQEDTLLFECKKTVEIQIRVLTADNDALNSDIIRVPVERCLESEVLV